MFKCWSSAKLYVCKIIKFQGLIEPPKFQSVKVFSFKIQKHNVFLWFSTFNKRQVNSVQNILLLLRVFSVVWINVRIKSVRAIWCYFSSRLCLWIYIRTSWSSTSISPHFTNVMNGKATVNNNRDSRKF